MKPSAAEVVRQAATKLRDARFARICQYTAEATGERRSVSRGQIDFVTGSADMEMPTPGAEGSAAIVVLRPPRSYIRTPDGSWMLLVSVSRESMDGTLECLESEALVATERGEAGDGRAFDFRVEVEDAQLPRGTVWIDGDGYLTKLERPARGERIAGVEFTAIGEPLALLSVPDAMAARRP